MIKVSGKGGGLLSLAQDPQNLLLVALLIYFPTAAKALILAEGTLPDLCGYSCVFSPLHVLMSPCCGIGCHAHCNIIWHLYLPSYKTSCSPLMEPKHQRSLLCLFVYAWTASTCVTQMSSPVRRCCLKLRASRDEQQDVLIINHWLNMPRTTHYRLKMSRNLSLHCFNFISTSLFAKTN